MEGVGRRTTKLFRSADARRNDDMTSPANCQGNPTQVHSVSLSTAPSNFFRWTGRTAKKRVTNDGSFESSRRRRSITAIAISSAAAGRLDQHHFTFDFLLPFHGHGQMFPSSHTHARMAVPDSMTCRLPYELIQQKR